MTDYFKINIGQTVEQQFKNDLQLEYDAVKRLNEGIQLCDEQNDAGSRELLEKILTDEEHHIDWLEAQLHAIGEMGIQNYLAQQLEERRRLKLRCRRQWRSHDLGCDRLIRYNEVRLRAALAQPNGEMAEWLKAHAWKACIGETLSRVRIPVSPPCVYYHLFKTIQIAVIVGLTVNWTAWTVWTEWPYKGFYPRFVLQNSGCLTKWGCAAQRTAGLITLQYVQSQPEFVKLSNTSNTRETQRERSMLARTYP